MPKFIVEIKEVYTVRVTVEAEDKQAAQTAAEEVLTNGINQDGTDVNDDAAYSYTMDRDEWSVEETK